MRILYPLAKRFIAGHDFDSEKGHIDKLIKQGYEVSIDYVGENSETQKDCARALKQYVRIIKFYKNNSRKNISLETLISLGKINIFKKIFLIFIRYRLLWVILH